MGESTLVTALVGLIGIAIGAWLNALLTTRRERWNLTRDLYSRLLESLGEAKYALNKLCDLELNEPYSQDESVQEGRRKWIEKLMERESRVVEEIRRATSVAAIMLGEEAIQALDKLQSEWAEAEKADSYFDHLDRRTAAANKAYALLVNAARKDLKMGKGIYKAAPLAC